MRIYMMYLHIMLNYITQIYSETDIDITKHREIPIFCFCATSTETWHIISFFITVIQHYVITYIFI